MTPCTERKGGRAAAPETTPYHRMTIRVAPDGRERTLILYVERESEKAVVGYPVNREGERLQNVLTGATELIIVTPGDIVRREPMVMNLHYGELEPVAPVKGRSS